MWIYSLLLAGSSGAFLANVYDYVASTSQSLIGPVLPAGLNSGQSEVIDAMKDISKSVVFRPLAPVDYAAETLQLMLQQTVVDFDDLLAAKQYARRNKGKQPPADFWRAQPLSIQCKPDESHGVLQKGHIKCSAELSERNRDPIKAVFATYYMIVADPMTRKFPEKKESSFNQYVDDLTGMAARLKEIPEMMPLQALFNSGSMGRRRFSPFHPEDAAFSMQLRMPSGLDNGQDETELICKLVLLSDAAGGCNFPLFSVNHPKVMYRLLYDPQFALPAGSPVVVDPPRSLNWGEHVKRHAADTRDFLGELIGKVSHVHAKWQVKMKDSSLVGRGMPGQLVQATVDLIEDLARGTSTVQCLDLTAPLPYRTGSLLAPPTASVFELDLFNRVLVGSKPGLWVVIRSQNQGEAILSQYVSVPFELQTLSEFKNWKPPMTDVLNWTKYYIHNGSKGLFFIILWDDDLEKYSEWYDQLDQSLHLSSSRSKTAPIPIQQQVIAVHAIPSVPSKGNSQSSSPSTPTFGRSSTEQLYPKLPAAVREAEQHKAAQEFYRQGLQQRSRRPIAPVTHDYSPLHDSSLEEQIDLHASQEIPRSPAERPVSMPIHFREDYKHELNEHFEQLQPIQPDNRIPQPPQQPFNNSPDWELMDSGNDHLDYDFQ